MEATPLTLDGKVLTTGEVPNTYILGTVQGAKILMPHGQKNESIKQKRYCNKLNKDICSRISVKIRLKKGKSVLLKSKVLPPLPLPLQRSGDMVLQSAMVKNIGFPLLPVSRWRAFFQKKQDFSI